MRFSLGHSFSSSENKFCQSRYQELSLILSQRSTHREEEDGRRPLAIALLRKQQVSWNDKPIVDCSSLALNLGGGWNLSQKDISDLSPGREGAVKPLALALTSPSRRPQPPPGRTQGPRGPPQRPSVQGLRRVCRKSSRKGHLGTCVTLTCSHSPGPGEPWSPGKFGSCSPGPLTLPRCAAQSAGGVSQPLG